jgi:hypothetical protein
VYEQLSSVPSIHLPVLDVFLSGLILPAPSADSLINPEGITQGKPKPKGQVNKPPTAGTPLPIAGEASKTLEASEAVAGLHLQLVRHAVARLGSERQRTPKLILPRQEMSPGPVSGFVNESTPAPEEEGSEVAGAAGPLPQTPRGTGEEVMSPTGGGLALSDSGEKVPARVSTRAPKWKAGLTNGEAPWALLMSRNMAKLNGMGHEMEKEAGVEAHHEGAPFRQGLELLDGMTWPAFARRVLEEEASPPKPPVEEEPVVDEVPKSEPIGVAMDGGAAPTEGATIEPAEGALVERAGEKEEPVPVIEEPVPLPIILTPVEIVRRAEREAEVLAEAERQLAKAAALLKGHEGPVTETAAPAVVPKRTDFKAPETEAPVPKSDQQAGIENGIPGIDAPVEPVEHFDFWWSPLEGMGPMNSNQGSKIRGKIQAALAMHPPEWARGDLKKVITRDVYRSSAGGPMKVRSRCISIAFVCLMQQSRVDTRRACLVLFFCS